MLMAVNATRATYKLAFACGVVPRLRRNAMMRLHPRLEIEYCTQCRWLLRAAWMAQELLTTFETELGEVALVPGQGGIFEVRLEGETIFSRKQEGRFPEAKELKQLVRDRVAPGKDLGHSDRR
jgi:selenoprotein W-related protein